MFPPSSEVADSEDPSDRTPGCARIRLRPFFLLFLILPFLFPLSNQLSAQTTTSGGLTGVVTDPSNAVVPDADIEIKNAARRGVLSQNSIATRGEKSSTREKRSHENLPLGSDRKFACY